VVEVRRRKNESFDSLLRRFSRRVVESGKVIQVKKIKYHQDKPNKNKVHKSALHRQKTRASHEYLKKIGKLPEERTAKKRR